MRTVKRLVKYVIVTSTLLLFVAIAQTGTAIYFSKAKLQLNSTDLVVVFPGDPKRITAGLAVLETGLADNFMIIGKTSPEQTTLLNKVPIQRKICVFEGGKSRSTFEDVYQTVKTIKEKQLSSVIVVSSSYHLPRALFLLKMFLTSSGQDVLIQGSCTHMIPRDKKILKQYSNEVIKFWGSFVEMTGFYVTGTLMLNFPPARKIQILFKRTFLWQ